MNAQTDHETFAGPRKTGEGPISYEASRARLLEAFFHLELAVAKWLRHLGEEGATKPLGQKLKRLVNHSLLADKATPNQRKQMLALESACGASLKLRNAVVHSSHQRFEIGLKGEQPCVFLTTIDCALSDDHSYFVVTLDELDRAAQNAKSLAGQLTNYLTQASSPLPPSPAAATGP